LAPGMPPGRDSFRRNRVAPWYLFYHANPLQPWRPSRHSLPLSAQASANLALPYSLNQLLTQFLFLNYLLLKTYN
jgi:hypothetical protein